MPIADTNLLPGALLLTAGAILFYLLGRLRVNRATGLVREELRISREALAHLTAYVDGAARRLSEHCDSMDELNRVLESAELPQVEFAVRAVDALARLNEKLHADLAATEDALQEQTSQLEQHKAEVLTDPLTRLANRRAFDREMSRRFSEYQRHGTSLSVMLIDIDHFKQTNDLHGHQVGDEVLRSVAATLRETMREPDLITRYGGEEFAILMPYTPIDKACDVAERVRLAIERTSLRFNGRNFSVTASIGVAELRSSEHPSVLVKRMDEALYQCKNSGRNNTHWHDGRTVRPFGARDESELAQPSNTSEAAVATGEHVLTGAGSCDSSAQVAAASADVSRAAPIKLAATRLPSAGPMDATTSAWPNDFQTHEDLLAQLADHTSFCQALRSRLAEWKRGGPGIAVLLIEIDNYDALIERDHHEAAKILRNTVTLALRSAVRDMDVLASYSQARLAILAPGCDHDNVLVVAERIHESVAKCRLRGCLRGRKLTVSLGLTEAMEGDDVVRILQRTETALQSARDAGGCRSYHHNGQWPEYVSAASGTFG